MENMSIFDLIFDNEFMDFIITRKFKDAYFVLLFGKLIENPFDKNEVENLTNFVEVSFFFFFFFSFFLKLPGYKL